MWTSRCLSPVRDGSLQHKPRTFLHDQPVGEFLQKVRALLLLLCCARACAHIGTAENRIDLIGMICIV